VNLVADIDAGNVEGIEDRPPTLAKFGEGVLDQPGWPLRPRIQVGPGQRA